ncbi:MAG: hypothetical protein ACRD4W_11750, partial [Nitrososphaeraceae archaeon]
LIGISQKNKFFSRLLGKKFLKPIGPSDILLLPVFITNSQYVSFTCLYRLRIFVMAASLISIGPHLKKVY